MLTKEHVVLRQAESTDAECLTALALRSKAYWGYPPAFMAACHEELTVTPARIGDDQAQFVIAERDHVTVGFYGITRTPGSAFELDALFVDPPHIGTGIGRTLIRDALAVVAALGGHTLVVQGDPNAVPFYRAAGGVPSGVRESGSVPGRYLPLFSFPLRGSGDPVDSRGRRAVR